MTAYISAVVGDRVEVLSDRAVYGPVGVVLEMVTKVRQLGNLPAVVMTSGLKDVGDVLEDAAAGAFDWGATVDDGIEEAAERLPMFCDVCRDAVEITVAGISESLGPCIWWMQTQPRNGRPAWQFETIKTGLAGSKIASPEMHGRMIQTGSLAGPGVFLMSELRSSPGDGVTFEGDHVVVGGAVDLTTVSRSGVVTRRLHNWPDRIGETLVRDATTLPGQREIYMRSALAMSSRWAAANQNNPSMNRQQRRAARRR